jgi:AraC-like DNA-binding protein
MHPNFSLPNQRDFHFSKTLPLNYNSFILRGSNIFTATDPSVGSIVQQEFTNTHYTIRFNVFDFLKPFRLKGTQTGSRLVSLLALKNNIHYSIEGIGTVRLKQGQFALLHTTDRPAVAQFTKSKPHECIEIAWSDEWLTPLLDKFNFLQALFTPTDNRKSFFLHPRPRPAGVKALDLVNTILTTPYDAAISRLLFESQVREYLILLLVEAAKKEVPLVPLTERERDILVGIGNRLRTSYDQQFPIADLSRESGMNVKKLKDGFREIHGDAISRVHMTARMQEARRLLLETELSTKQIAEKVGYRLTTSFIKNFGKYFGYYPSEVPRNQ